MRIKILGSAAGGGFPQWNCSCRNCRLARGGSSHFQSRTQTQIAFSPDPDFAVWFLVGASPDLRAQINATPELSPRSEGTSPIGGVFLNSADVDSVMGLLHLREFQTFFVFATSGVQRALKKENRLFNVLDRANPPVQWQTLSNRGRLGCHLSESPGESPAFIANTIPLGGSYPDYVSEELANACLPDDASIGLILEQAGKQIFIAPSLSPRSTEWTKPASTADIILIDGTFWSDDELIHTGRSKKTAREIGHLPLSGPAGLLEQFPANARGRKILIHINNTNPLLDQQSAEHRAVLDAGFEIAYDGMELTL